MSSASHRHVIVTVGVLPPSDERDFELLGVHLAHELTVAAGVAASVTSLAAGVCTFGVATLAALLAADAAVGFVTVDAGFGVLVEGPVAVATLGVGRCTGTATLGVATFGWVAVFALDDAAGVLLSGPAFSSVAGRDVPLPLRAAATSARDKPFVGVLVKPTGRGGRTAAGCSRRGPLVRRNSPSYGNDVCNMEDK